MLKNVHGRDSETSRRADNCAIELNCLTISASLRKSGWRTFFCVQSLSWALGGDLQASEHSFEPANQGFAFETNSIYDVRQSSTCDVKGYRVLFQMQKQKRSEHANIFRMCSDIMELIQDIPVPVICEVGAFATAAGCQLVASCDVAVASEEARFCTPG